MKRITLTIAILGVLAALAIPARHLTSVGAATTCESYVTADQDCQAKEWADYRSCMIVTGDGTRCLEHSIGIYNGCMAAWGCDVIPKIGPVN